MKCHPTFLLWCGHHPLPGTTTSTAGQVLRISCYLFFFGRANDAAALCPVTLPSSTWWLSPCSFHFVLDMCFSHISICLLLVFLLCLFPGWGFLPLSNCSFLLFICQELPASSVLIMECLMVFRSTPLERYLLWHLEWFSEEGESGMCFLLSWSNFLVVTFFQ